MTLTQNTTYLRSYSIHKGHNVRGFDFSSQFFCLNVDVFTYEKQVFVYIFFTLFLVSKINHLSIRIEFQFSRTAHVCI